MPIRHAVSLETDCWEAKHTRISYRITTSPTLAPRPTECFRYGEVAPRRSTARQRRGGDGTGAVASVRKTHHDFFRLPLCCSERHPRRLPPVGRSAANARQHAQRRVSPVPCRVHDPPARRCTAAGIAKLRFAHPHRRGAAGNWRKVTFRRRGRGTDFPWRPQAGRQRNIHRVASPAWGRS